MTTASKPKHEDFPLAQFDPGSQQRVPWFSIILNPLALWLMLALAAEFDGGQFPSSNPLVDWVSVLDWLGGTILMTSIVMLVPHLLAGFFALLGWLFFGDAILSRVYFFALKGINLAMVLLWSWGSLMIFIQSFGPVGWS